MNFNALRQSPVYDCLSIAGKRMFQPNGIYYWTNRAKNESTINGTIGTAVGLESDLFPTGEPKEVPYYLPQIRDFINLPPEKIVPYAPISGIPQFRDLWKKWIIHKGMNAKNMPSGPRNISEHITTPMVCHGITNAIYITSRLFLNPGDQIIVPNKRWGNYNSVLGMQNEIISTSFQFFHEGKFNLKGFRDTMLKVAEQQHHIVVVLNFPNNPTGYSPNQEEMKAIVDLLREVIETTEKQIIALCDDAYEGYVYSDEVATNSIFYELVNLHPYLIPLKLDGTSKEMLLYGGRLACITLGLHDSWIDEGTLTEFDTEWENKIQAMIRSTISTANHCFQQILADILSKGFETVEQARSAVIETLKIRYQACLTAFNKYKSKKTSLDPGGGGFFIFLNVEGISANELADYLLKKYKVGLFPNENQELGINGIRVAYCSIPLDKIEPTMKAIYDAVENYPN